MWHFFGSLHYYANCLNLLIINFFIFGYLKHVIIIISMRSTLAKALTRDSKKLLARINSGWDLEKKIALKSTRDPAWETQKQWQQQSLKAICIISIELEILPVWNTMCLLDSWIFNWVYICTSLLLKIAYSISYNRMERNLRGEKLSLFHSFMPTHEYFTTQILKGV